LLLFWLKKVDTSWAPVGENRDAYFLRREITWGLAQWKRTCCSSWTSSVSHRSQVGEGVTCYSPWSMNGFWKGAGYLHFTYGEHKDRHPMKECNKKRQRTICVRHLVDPPAFHGTSQVYLRHWSVRCIGQSRHATQCLELFGQR